MLHSDGNPENIFWKKNQQTRKKIMKKLPSVQRDKNMNREQLDEI